ncbi:hypothetical protein BK133_11060 [Paenibacillus sp. FSL H8-0548]|uniref:antA/AntB antirepressor family protein n=1 Tax=Paenibacillus sp. FSL H8-0548 TaxID=1920422 RepID=UPI00096D089D|nr:antA/AntB antirepressor family protein [Paenibacillus sp. FSL H8-0548]OMF35243.1 hypothetical protein BK133_11060 [Paenibacillus sp. FSL H8-0548]
MKKLIVNELLPIYETDAGEKVVDGRELHEFLDVSSKFADWIKNRITKYGFAENDDYATVSKILESGGKSIDYVLKLDMAKELCMVENNEQGSKARKYFIDIEKRYKQQTINTSLLSPEMQMFKTIFDGVARTQLEQAEDRKELEAVKSRVDTLTTNLTAAPNHTAVVKRVDEYVRWTRLGHNEVYNRIYDIMQAKHGIDVRQRVENERVRINDAYFDKTGKFYAVSTLKQKVNGIDVMVRMGVLDKFNEILVGLLAKEKENSLPLY